MLPTSGHATSVHQFQSLHDMHAAWLRQLLYCSKYLCSPSYACIIRRAYCRSTEACDDPDFGGLVFCLFIAYLALLHFQWDRVVRITQEACAIHPIEHCAPDNMVARHMILHIMSMYVLQQFHVSENMITIHVRNAILLRFEPNLGAETHACFVQQSEKQKYAISRGNYPHGLR